MSSAIHIEGVSKHFRFPASHQKPTLKDIVVKSLRRERDFTVVHALRDVTFDVNHGSMLGVLGRNGSGKTTLLRILAGIIRPDSGKTVVNGTIAPLLALGLGFHPDLTGREGARIELLSLGMTRKQATDLIGEIIAFAEIGDFADAPVRTYSTGMLMRLAFAVAVCVDPDVLLLDEVLAVGDEDFAKKCLNCITDFRNRGKTIVLVTHNAEIVETFCDTALWLDRGRVAGFGEPKTVAAAYHAFVPPADS